MIFVAAAILIAAALALTLIVRQRDLPEPEPPSPTAHLEEKKKVIYEGLRDLQFEYRMNKLSDEDYQQTKLELQRQLAAVLAEMESVLSRDRKGAVSRAPAKARYVCPKCSTEFPQPMKFCGECGQPMPAS
jgi:rRNA maturation endonuclease Nob1